MVGCLILRFAVIVYIIRFIPFVSITLSAKIVCIVTYTRFDMECLMPEVMRTNKERDTALKTL